VREWGVLVRLISMGTMSTCVPDECERSSAYARGVYFFYDEVVGVFKGITCALFPFSYLNFTNSGIPASRGGMADEAGFYEFHKVGFVCRGFELGGQHILGQGCGVAG
jgi:hypothetical protein